MDVRCNRCGTDYEFDDTLISDRGTTVQCTNCGYQFKIHPPKVGKNPPERWQVRTAAGKDLFYTSLRELQRAITEHKVGPRDLLSRGAQAGRPLGSIPELEPFFTSAGGVARGLQSVPRTLHGVAPPATGAPRPPAGDEKQGERQTQLGIGQKTLGYPSKDAPAFSSTLPEAASPAPRDSKNFATQPAMPMVLGSAAGTASTAADTVRDPEPPRIEPAPVEPARIEPARVQQAPPKKPRGPEPDTRVSAAPPTGVIQPKQGSTVRIERPKSPLTAAANLDTTLPAASPPALVDRPRKTVEPQITARMEPRKGPASSPFDATLPVASSPVASSPIASSPRPAPAPAPPPISTRERLPSYDDLPDVHAVEPAHRARSRWIAGVVFLAVAGLLAATVGRQYLARFSTAKKPELAARDERAARFLAEGNRLLARADYDAAQEQITKAQALADRDPSVLAARARLDTLRADTLWLKLRLLDPASSGLVQETQKELGRVASRARAAVESAFAVAPEDPSVVRARVDSLRIAGEEAKAREWIAPIASNASDPQNAYVLAALDLAEATPVWSTVIDRLRAASVSEQEAPRARGALVYALVRAGRVVEADTELSKIAAAPYPHPLLGELKSFVARFSAPLDGGVETSRDGSAAVAAPSSSVQSAGSAAASAGVAAAAGDFRARLRQAAEAAAKGNLVRAEDLYQSVVDEQPGNTEALAGLADVARRRGDGASAGRLYDQVLASNPNYLPALSGSADQKWNSGDRKGALVLYRRILEHAGASTDYGRRAASRVAEAEAAASAPAASAAPTPAPGSPTEPGASPDSAAPAEPAPPQTGTSDQPGVPSP